MYPTRRDYSWLIDAPGAPPSPLPLQQDAKEFSLPREIDDKISAVFDAYGWERHVDAVAEIATGTDVDFIQSSFVPRGRLRCVFDISVSTSNDVLPFTVSLDHSVSRSLVFVGIMGPMLIPVGSGGQRFSPGRTIVLAPGDSLVFRLDQATGVGETLELRQRIVDIPIGEYIPPR